MASNFVPEHHYRQLDALRGIAVVAVLDYHFHSGAWTGHAAVRLFFVLSGFLITAILTSINWPDQSLGGRWLNIRNFFLRRALRISPAYFLIIAILLVLNLDNIRRVALWHILFASNVLFSLQNQHVPWEAAAWWSVSVEEQFYLIWPLLMVLSSERFRSWIAIAAILIGCCWHVSTLFDDRLGAYYLPPASLDALGAGALLALSKSKFKRWRSYFMPVIATSVAATGFAIFMAWPAQIYDLLSLPGMVALVAGATVGFTGITGWFLNLRPLRGLGKISYGLYLYHFAVLAALLRLCGNDSFIAFPTWTRFLAAGSASVLVALLSWYFVERPTNRLKRYFPMRASSKQSEHQGVPLEGKPDLSVAPEMKQVA